MRSQNESGQPRTDSPSKLRELRERIRDAVFSVEPGAEIVLYGSRARGDARSDSDWDLLVLLDGEVDNGREDELRDRQAMKKDYPVSRRPEVHCDVCLDWPGERDVSPG